MIPDFQFNFFFPRLQKDFELQLELQAKKIELRAALLEFDRQKKDLDEKRRKRKEKEALRRQARDNSLIAALDMPFVPAFVVVQPVIHEEHDWQQREHG